MKPLIDSLFGVQLISGIRSRGGASHASWRICSFSRLKYFSRVQPFA
jgi:hypothetical protein